MRNRLTSQWVNSIILGDARTILQELPDESVNCIITSPPYYRQRNYESTAQIGNEASPEEYVINKYFSRVQTRFKK